MLEQTNHWGYTQQRKPDKLTIDNQLVSLTGDSDLRFNGKLIQSRFFKKIPRTKSKQIQQMFLKIIHTPQCTRGVKQLQEKLSQANRQ